MSRDVYQNQTVYRSWEVMLRDRNRNETKPTVTSGTYTLIGVSGDIVVPLTNVTVTAPNIVSFLLRPTSGTATIGQFSELFEIFVGSENFQKQETIYVRERF